MTLSEKEYRRALAYLDEKLSMPRAERERWLNGIIDQWIAACRAARKRKRSRK